MRHYGIKFLKIFFVSLVLYASSQSLAAAAAADLERKHWSLQEWMEQKDRNRLMDLWLKLNTGDPYEMFLRGTYSSYTRSQASLADQTFISYQFQMAGYAQLVGLDVEYENNSQELYSDLNGKLSFRIFGESLRSSHLLLQVGQRTRNRVLGAVPVAVRNTLAQANLQLYFLKHFGVESFYRSYLNAQDDAQNEVSGSLTQACLFLDFKNIRIWGGWFGEHEIVQAQGGTPATTERTGVKSGVQIFF